MRSEVSKVLRLPRKRIVWRCRKSIAPATQNDFWHVLKHVGMSRSATPATRNEATQRYKLRPFCKTYHRHGHTVLTRTVANGCERLRTVANTNATSGEHSSTPTRPEWNGNPCYAFGKKWGGEVGGIFLVKWGMCVLNSVRDAVSVVVVVVVALLLLLVVLLLLLLLLLTVILFSSLFLSSCCSFCYCSSCMFFPSSFGFTDK